MRTLAAVILAGGILASATAVQAQRWGGWYGERSDYSNGDWAARSVCSGQRAHQLEDRLRHETYEGEIDRGRADRIHDSIDRLEYRARHECDEGDGRAIWDISRRYDRIAQWIENDAHGRW